MSERNIVLIHHWERMFKVPLAILGNTLYSKWSFARDKIPSDPVVCRVWGNPDDCRSGTAQTENTVRHTKYGRIRGMVVGECGRSTGVLLFYSTGMVKYFFDIECYHYVIQHPILVPEV